MVASRQLLVVVLIVACLVFLMGCTGTSAVLPLLSTPDATQSALSETMMANAATGTAQIIAVTSDGLRLQNVQAQATAQAVQQTAEAFWYQQTQTEADRLAAATRAADLKTQVAIQETAYAVATATERAWSLSQTQLAGYQTSTAQAWQFTEQAMIAAGTQTAQVKSTEMRWTQAAVDIQTTIDAAHALALATSQAANAGIAAEAREQERIRTIQQDSVKYVWAVLPFILIALVVFLGIGTAWLWQRLRVLPRGPHGEEPIVIIDGRVVKTGLQMLPVLNPRSPFPMEAAQQMQFNENHQKLEAIRALAGSGQASSARRITNELPTNALAVQSQVRVVPPETVQPWLTDVLPGIYRDAVELDLNQDRTEGQQQ